MAFDIPTIEPTSHEAGTDLIFTRSFADYSSGTWTLTYAARNATAAPIDFTATAATNGADFNINVPYATTETWTDGEYWLVGYVTETAGGDRHRVYEGRFTVKPYVFAQQAYEWRSWARQVRDALRDAILTRSGSDVISYSINGRSFTYSTTAEAMEKLNYFEAKVRHEESKGRQRKILVRFT
jgi:hypothetical protein